MADLHQAFGLFYEQIALSPANKAVLKGARNAVRERIRNYFCDTLKLLIPEFHGQGAYAMDTIVNPIKGEYDIDDGVYLQHLDCQNNCCWPSTDIVHWRLVNATSGHAQESPLDMDACVRVRYAGKYRIDLSTYAALNGRYLVAAKGESDWPQSDALALTRWFGANVGLYGEQLRRVVCYLKAWADFQSMHRGKMPGGLILTVLAVNHFQSHERDDAALAYTLRAISNTVSKIVYVLNPVDFSEVLTARLSDVQKPRFRNAVKAAAEDALRAIGLDDRLEASRLWRRQLGDRFPVVPEGGKRALLRRVYRIGRGVKM